jgi:hypothetical protein
MVKSKIHLLIGLNRCACNSVLPYSAAFTIDPHSVTCLRCRNTKVHEAALLKRNAEIRSRNARKMVQPDLLGK